MQAKITFNGVLDELLASRQANKCVAVLVCYRPVDRYRAESESQAPLKYASVVESHS